MTTGHVCVLLGVWLVLGAVTAQQIRAAAKDTAVSGHAVVSGLHNSIEGKGYKE